MVEILAVFTEPADGPSFSRAVIWKKKPIGNSLLEGGQHARRKTEP